MNRMIMIGLFVLIITLANAQQKKRSLLFIDKPQSVKVQMPKPTIEQKFANNLRKAGSGLVIGSLLFGLGAILRSNNESSKEVTNVLQIGGFGGLIYSGVVLQQAASDYEKYIQQNKSPKVSN